MHDLNTLPSKSSSSRTNGHRSNGNGKTPPPSPLPVHGEGEQNGFVENGYDANAEPEFLAELTPPPNPLPVHGEGEQSQSGINAKTMPPRGRSLRMQYRFWRTLAFAARL